MNVNLLLRTIHFYVFVMCVCFCSCTKEKTDYEGERETVVEEKAEFKVVESIGVSNYLIHIEALNGTLYRGYNEIRLRILNNQTKSPVQVAAVTLLPIQTAPTGEKSTCPHQYVLDYKPDGEYFAGYTVFTAESGSTGNWVLSISFTVENQTYSLIKEIQVQPQTNKNLNMASFIGSDNEQYVIALVAPHKPNVSENKLVAGIYKANKRIDLPANDPLGQSLFFYTAVEGYTLQLDPRMPEPSMGNHSSPNNKDLTQGGDGLYHGIVNYTMTGNWTLNFILLDDKGKTIRGTEVPKDFTPGVEGHKSELYIDILF